MKIAFIGAGSFVFARKLVVDLCSFADLPAVDLVLMDIDADRLETTRNLVEEVVKQTGRTAEVSATLERPAALDGADLVLAMYEPDGLEARRREVMTCLAHGVPLAIGDTLAAAGVFKGVRTGVVTLDVARAMERYCPQALFMNYVNPMAINCRVVSDGSRIQSVGMCHGLEHTREFLAGILDVDAEALNLRGWGINHMLWIFEMTADGQDLYPLLRERADRVRHIDPVRFALLDATGYYVTESSYHSAEYVPYFREWFKSLYVSDVPREDYNDAMGYWARGLIHPSTGSGGRVEPFIPLGWDIHLYEKVHARTREQERKQLLSEGTVDVTLSEEYAMRIAHSLSTGRRRTLSLNVPNDGWIPNLPRGATVELPVRVDGAGLAPEQVGNLPEPCASLCRRNVEVQTEVVRGILEQDPRAIWNAVLLDPLTGACLDPARLKQLFDAMIEADRELLPPWLDGKRI